jgi:hypothetical protein
MAKIIAKRKPAKKVQPAKPAPMIGPLSKQEQQGSLAAKLPKSVIARLQSQVRVKPARRKASKKK